MNHSESHPDYPLASFLLAIFAVACDINSYDAMLFAPFAHIMAGVSGSIAAILGIIALKEKFYPKK